MSKLIIVQTRSTNIVTYNMHGFNQGVMTISELCEKYDFVFVQEHWLAPFDLHRIDAVCNKCLCFSTSAITTKINSGIMRGRPFGGVSVIVKMMLQYMLNLFAKLRDL